MINNFFLNTKQGVLDEKSRLVVPKVFRREIPAEILSGIFYLTPHSRGYLIIRPGNVWDEFISSIRETTELSSKDKLRLEKELFANSLDTKLDRQHRIVLSKDMRGKLLFPDSSPRQSIQFVGRGGYFEIWPDHLYKGEEESIGIMSELLDRYEGV